MTRLRLVALGGVAALVAVTAPLVVRAQENGAPPPPAPQPPTTQQPSPPAPSQEQTPPTTDQPATPQQPPSVEAPAPPPPIAEPPPPAPPAGAKRSRNSKPKHRELMRALKSLEHAKGDLSRATRESGDHRTKAQELTEQAIQEIRAALQSEQ
jgi:hypothetical protein